jgi:hypothetical protein
MSLIEGYRENVRTITVTDQTFLVKIWVKTPKNVRVLRFLAKTGEIWGSKAVNCLKLSEKLVI